MVVVSFVRANPVKIDMIWCDRNCTATTHNQSTVYSHFIIIIKIGLVERTKRQRRKQPPQIQLYLRSCFEENIEDFLRRLRCGNANDVRCRNVERMARPADRETRNMPRRIASIVEHKIVIMELMVERERCLCVRAIIMEEQRWFLHLSFSVRYRQILGFACLMTKTPFAEAIRFVRSACAVVVRRPILCGKKSDLRGARVQRGGPRRLRRSCFDYVYHSMLKWFERITCSQKSLLEI